MVVLIATPAISSAVNEAYTRLNTSPCHDPALLASILALDHQNDPSFAIPHALLNEISRFLGQAVPERRQEYRFRTLLKGTRFYKPPTPVRERSPELTAILEKIKTDLDNKAYADMVRDVTSDADKSKIQGEDARALRDGFRQMASITNVLFSVASVFVAIYFAASHVSNDPGMKTLIALGFSLIVLLAEGYFFARDWLVDSDSEGPRLFGQPGSVSLDSAKQSDGSSAISKPAREKKND
ncbi:endoplasmic reticulum-based factor for assembly of V-ATPase-domain-containing protein [Polychytrium aggregatum]|uniref:endoplasmic reticulum-based factor for assembly of V-ATPase-domain-containing protein n=1 Tax=Polychytrium aggregatum TaxID=110093 RepID=UPI0022FDFCE5|nr:endoplasmic reticulum-based factor for assembly of V-ATPase-domain-containing protein [Polychytrium aggregatum]KAI9208054.1 endoplasmic reticulum-based factor for assembly of V-ATPase-domain-containing protein [Polychytrium aggregatum]